MYFRVRRGNPNLLRTRCRSVEDVYACHCGCRNSRLKPWHV